MIPTLGYHGCNLHTAQQLLSGMDFVDSERDYPWLGKGIYFWESDPQRALQWAINRSKSPPCVVGAAIDLGNCLDLTNQKGLRAVSPAYTSYTYLQSVRGAELSKNTDPPGVANGDLLLRRLDRDVIEHLYSLQSETEKQKPFETVRALFPEGEPLYENAGFRKETHVQICVRDHSRIFGVFRVPDWQCKVLGLPDQMYS